MVTVRKLVDFNPVMIQAVLTKKSWITRLTGQDHWHMIKKYDENVTEHEQKMACLVQAILGSIHCSTIIGFSVFNASHLGQMYWNIARVAAFVGGIFGILEGALSNHLTILEYMKCKSDIYASYKTRFKVLQPLHELAFSLFMCAIGVFAVSRIPSVGMINACISPALIAANVGQLISHTFVNFFFKTVPIEQKR